MRGKEMIMRTIACGTWRDEILGDNEISVYQREDGTYGMSYDLFDAGVKGRSALDLDFFNLTVQRFDMEKVF